MAGGRVFITFIVVFKNVITVTNILCACVYMCSGDILLQVINTSLFLINFR